MVSRSSVLPLASLFRSRFPVITGFLFLLLLPVLPHHLAEADVDSLATKSGTGTITLSIEGIRLKDRGEIVAGLFSGEDGWLKKGSAYREIVVPADAETLVVSFESVPRDTGYAVTVVHDKNGNGEVDMRWFPFPKPKEGTGISNNHPRKGPPEYDKARFALADSVLVLSITMRY